MNVVFMIINHIGGTAAFAAGDIHETHELAVVRQSKSAYGIAFFFNPAAIIGKIADQFVRFGDGIDAPYHRAPIVAVVRMRGVVRSRVVNPVSGRPIQRENSGSEGKFRIYLNYNDSLIYI